MDDALHIFCCCVSGLQWKSWSVIQENYWAFTCASIKTCEQCSDNCHVSNLNFRWLILVYTFTSWYTRRCRVKKVKKKKKICRNCTPSSLAVIRCHPLSPAVPCHHPLSPVTNRCHLLSPVVTRYHPVSPVVTSSQNSSPVLIRHHSSPVITRCHPLWPILTHNNPLRFESFSLIPNTTNFG